MSAPMRAQAGTSSRRHCTSSGNTLPQHPRTPRRQLPVLRHVAGLHAHHALVLVVAKVPHLLRLVHLHGGRARARVGLRTTGAQGSTRTHGFHTTTSAFSLDSASTAPAHHCTSTLSAPCTAAVSHGHTMLSDSSPYRRGHRDGVGRVRVDAVRLLADCHHVALLCAPAREL